MKSFLVVVVYSFFLNLVCVGQQLTVPKWSNSAVIYEVNVRQYSAKGDFASVTKDLNRLKNLGIDVLWVMPVHPIGEKNRKGTIGSYYSVKDYRGIDQSYGTAADFKTLVQTAHKLGMKVLIDWVANHTAWDHQWITQHPDWYVQNDKGEIQTQYDWSDVAKLNYNNKEMRKAMTEDMKYWVTEFDIDGFRCDVAFLVPLDFWEENRKQLELIKPMFMLAEMEWNTDITPTPNNYFNNAFNASYGWTFMGVTGDIAKGKKTFIDFRTEMKLNYDRFLPHMLKLFYITNHDENSWNGTVEEKYGNDWKLYSALCYTLPQSFPLIYTGEEAGLNRRLKFFEKDPITPKEWKDTTRYSWYRSLTHLKHTNKAIWNNSGSEFKELQWSKTDSTVMKNVYAFSRKNGKDELTVIINIGNEQQQLKATNWVPSKGKTLYNKKIIIDPKGNITLPPHSVFIHTKN